MAKVIINLEYVSAVVMEIRQFAQRNPCSILRRSLSAM